MNSYIINNEHFKRNIRNELLNKQTNIYYLLSYNIRPTNKIKIYRQELRVFINNNEIKILAGEKVEYPQQPDFINLNILY